MRDRTLAMYAVLLAFPVSVLVGFVLRGPDDTGCTRTSRAQVEMGEIQKALNQYSLDHASYPASLAELQQDYFRNGVPDDPFNKRPYDYLTDGKRFVLICYGRDDQPGGAEPPDTDIVYTEAGLLGP